MSNQNIKKGDRVFISKGLEAKEHRGRTFEVISDPYDVCGITVVKIKCGDIYIAGFRVDFLFRLSSASA